jgi:hypothetical protein
MTLREKYREIMERVVVTDEMRQRILRNICSTDAVPETKTIRFPHWQRYAAAAACFAILLIGAVAVSGIYHPLQENPAVSAPDGNALAEGTPSAVCKSAAELSKAIGFPVSDIDTLPFEPTAAVYSSLFGETAEIDYTGADGQSATYRKSRGTDDNSGIYDTFADTEQISAGNVKATVKGDGTQYTLAVWTDGTYAYSIELSDGVGIDVWKRIIKGVS